MLHRYAVFLYLPAPWVTRPFPFVFLAIWGSFSYHGLIFFRVSVHAIVPVSVTARATERREKRSVRVLWVEDRFEDAERGNKSCAASSKAAGLARLSRRRLCSPATRGARKTNDPLSNAVIPRWAPELGRRSPARVASLRRTTGSGEGDAAKC